MTANEYMKKIKDNLDSVDQNLEQIQCDDCISRQAVLDEMMLIPIAPLMVGDGVVYKKGVLEGTIKALPSVTPKPKWIPVSERLPDNNDDVLVYDYSDIFVAWYSGIDGNWCSADNRFDEYTPIIAWQPLPEPYDPQESEDKE